MDLTKRIYEMLSKKEKINFIIIVGIMIVSAVLSQIVPLSIGRLTDDVLKSSNMSFGFILPLLLFILVVSVANEIIKVVRRVVVEDTCTRCEKESRSRAVSSLLHANLDYFKDNMTGNIHGRLNRSLEGVIRLLKLSFMDFAPAIFSGGAAIIVIFLKLPFFLACLMLLVIPIGVIIVLRQIHTQKGIRVELMEEKSNMDGVMVELINGIEVIRVLDNTNREVERFRETSEYLRKKEMKHHKAMAFYDSLKFINEAIFTVFVIGISAYFASINIISVGTVITAYLCFRELTTPLRELHRILDEVSESTVLADEYFKIIDIDKDFSYNVKKGSVVKNNSLIHVSNLDFYYNKGSRVIDKLNLDISSGEFIGIAGGSGCGKSTFIKILVKLYKKSNGSIIINNKNINNLTREDISNMISYVSQNPFLIAGTIRENICYGIDRDVSDDEVREALKRSRMLKFVDGLKSGVDTLVSEGGSNLSGGQRQRIALARIFLRKPKILILDEATSALDNTTEKYIQKEIEKLREEDNITIISIAHRLTTLKNCDRILVFDKGKIVDSGKYNELIKRKGIFKDMYNGKIK